MPNLVQIGQETAEKRWQEKKANRQKIRTDILKIAFLPKKNGNIVKSQTHYAQHAGLRCISVAVKYAGSGFTIHICSSRRGTW